MKLPREVKSILASFCILVSLLIAEGVVKMIFEYGVTDLTMQIALSGIFLLGCACLMSIGLDTIVNIVGVLSTEDSISAILYDFPEMDDRDTGEVERRITRLLLIREEECLMLVALEKSLQKRSLAKA